ncbi:hypothetical protein [Helicobacter bilis]|nr:hypothetical protein [Helicobacter bilis]
MKKLAIHLIGHTRTYKDTAESFLKNIVETNKEKWDIDIFMHTWDMFEPVAQTSWHKDNATLSGKPLSQDDKDDIINTYKPKRYAIETLQEERGFMLSYKRANEIRREYAKQHNIEYDYMLYTRYDILFTTKLDISYFIDSYYEIMQKENRLINGGGGKLCFVGHNIFGRMPFLEYVPEPDLIWFANYDSDDNLACSSGIHEGLRPIDYRLYRDFFIQRMDHTLKTHSNVDALTMNMKDYIARLSYAYKIGEALLLNTKHFVGFLRLPIILYYIKKQHKQQGKYNLEVYYTHNECIDSISTIGKSYIESTEKGIKHTLSFLISDLPKLKCNVK